MCDRAPCIRAISIKVVLACRKDGACFRAMVIGCMRHGRLSFHKGPFKFDPHCAAYLATSSVTNTLHDSRGDVISEYCDMWNNPVANSVADNAHAQHAAVPTPLISTLLEPINRRRTGGKVVFSTMQHRSVFTIAHPMAAASATHVTSMYL